MSEFECRFGHLMRPSAMYCEECEEMGIMHSKAVRMDGRSAASLEREERYFRDHPEEENDDDNDEDEQEEEEE